MSEAILSAGWNAAGLPMPQETGYGYEIAAGLLRTPFAAARPRQRRAHTEWTRTFTVECELTQEQLQIAESALVLEGYSWFLMTLISGDEEFSDQLVRLIAPWSVAAISSTQFSLSMTLETAASLMSAFYSTALYPLVETDTAGMLSPSPFDGYMNDQVDLEEGTTVTAPVPISGSLLLTTLWIFYSTDDETSVTAPVPVSGTLVQTVFWQYYTAVEDTTVTAPVPVSGTLLRTMIHYALSDRIESTAPGAFSGSLTTD